MTAEELLDPSASRRQPPAGYIQPEEPTAVVYPETQPEPLESAAPIPEPAVEPVPSQVTQEVPRSVTREIPMPDQPTMAYQVPVKQSIPSQPAVNPQTAPIQPQPVAQPLKASPVKALAQVFGWISFGLYVISLLVLPVAGMLTGFLEWPSTHSIFLGLALLCGMVMLLGSCLSIGRSRVMTLVGMLLSAGLIGMQLFYNYFQNGLASLLLLLLTAGVLALVSGFIGVFARPRKNAVGVIVVTVVFTVLCLLCLAAWVVTGGLSQLLGLPVLFTL